MALSRIDGLGFPASPSSCFRASHSAPQRGSFEPRQELLSLMIRGRGLNLQSYLRNLWCSPFSVLAQGLSEVKLTTSQRWQGVEGERWPSKPRLLTPFRHPPHHLERGWACRCESVANTSVPSAARATLRPSKGSGREISLLLFALALINSFRIPTVSKHGE
jgi:hypothetical protein